MRQHRIMPRGLAGDAIGKALTLQISVREFILVVKGAAADQVVDVGAIGAVGVAEDP